MGQQCDPGVDLRENPEDVPSSIEWKAWCQSAVPTDVKDVHGLGKIKLSGLVRLESDFLSHSTLRLISMPIFLWDRLPDNPAYSFVSYVASRNRVQRPTVTVSDETHLQNSQWTLWNPFRRRHGTGGKPFSFPNHRDALEFLENIVRENEEMLGNEDEKTLGSMSNLAFAYMQAGRFSEAVTIQAQVLEVRIVRLGEKHHVTALAQRYLLFLLLADPQIMKTDFPERRFGKNSGIVAGKLIAHSRYLRMFLESGLV